MGKKRRYSLRKSYQLRQNRLTIRIMFPMSVIHSAGFLLYLCMSLVSRNVGTEMDAPDYATLVEAVHSVGQKGMCNAKFIRSR